MRYLCLMTAVALCGLIQSAAQAGGGCSCNHCGGDMMCKLVCFEKEVKITCYGCDCEQFCVPNCSKLCGTHCDECCADGGAGCECKCGHDPHCKIKYRTWEPGCANVRDKKVLVKYECTKKIPAYKWVVVPCGCCGEEAAPADAPKPTKAALKRAPAGARVGEAFPVSDAELRQLSPDGSSPATKAAPVNTQKKGLSLTSLFK